MLIWALSTTAYLYLVAPVAEVTGFKPVPNLFEGLFSTSTVTVPPVFLKSDTITSSEFISRSVLLKVNVFGLFKSLTYPTAFPDNINLPLVISIAPEVLLVESV